MPFAGTSAEQRRHKYAAALYYVFVVLYSGTVTTHSYRLGPSNVQTRPDIASKQWQMVNVAEAINCTVTLPQQSHLEE